MSLSMIDMIGYELRTGVRICSFYQLQDMKEHLEATESEGGGDQKWSYKRGNIELNFIREDKYDFKWVR